MLEKKWGKLFNIKSLPLWYKNPIAQSQSRFCPIIHFMFKGTSPNSHSKTACNNFLPTLPTRKKVILIVFGVLVLSCLQNVEIEKLAQAQAHRTKFFPVQHSIIITIIINLIFFFQLKKPRREMKILNRRRSSEVKQTGWNGSGVLPIMEACICVRF